MIRHIFMGTANPGVSEEQLNELVHEWNQLRDKVPGVLSLTAGKNLGLRDAKISVGLVADLEDMDAWETYMTHPAHTAISQRLTTKIIDANSRVVVQLEV